MKKGGLKLFEPWIGEWEIELTNAWFLESMDLKKRGSGSFKWLRGGFVEFTFGVGEQPPAVCIIGYSDAQERYELFYRDDRDVSRIFSLEFDGKTFNFHREDADFYQRFSVKLRSGRIVAKAEASEDKGETWRKDFDLTFTRK